MHGLKDTYKTGNPIKNTEQPGYSTFCDDFEKFTKNEAIETL